MIHAPADPDGLWIRRVVAAALNEREVEEMRDGYRTGTYNSRGAHIIDPTASPERELAEQFRNKAEEIENAEFQRFAVTLKGLANSYDREADQILNDNNDRMDE